MARTAKRPCGDKPETQRPRTRTKTSKSPSSSSPSHLPTTEPLTNHTMDFNNDEKERDHSIIPSLDAGNQGPDQGEEEKKTAAQKVFSMSEMVEIMLDDMTSEELFEAVRINRTFCDTIAQLLRFQHRMFLAPTNVYHRAERAVNGYLKLHETIELNRLISLDDWTMWQTTMHLEDYLGLDKCFNTCEYWLSRRCIAGIKTGCFQLFVDVESKEMMLRLGLDSPSPVTRTTLTQPVFSSDLMMLWPSDPLTETLRIAGVTTKREIEKVVARVTVIPTNLGQWLAVARAFAAHEPSLDDWVRKFAGRPQAMIEVAKTAFPPEVQEVICGNATYTHSWNGPGT